MFALLIQWLLYAIALMAVSKIVPGFYVAGLWPALIASLVIGLLNATLGLLLKIVTFPISILTFGLFLLVINGMMILLASHIVLGRRGACPARHVDPGGDEGRVRGGLLQGEMLFRVRRCGLSGSFVAWGGRPGAERFWRCRRRNFARYFAVRRLRRRWMRYHRPIEGLRRAHGPSAGEAALRRAVGRQNDDSCRWRLLN